MLVNVFFCTTPDGQESKDAFPVDCGISVLDLEAEVKHLATKQGWTYSRHEVWEQDPDTNRLIRKVEGG